MEWLVIYPVRDDMCFVSYDDKESALDAVKNILEDGDVSLGDIQVFEAKRKKIVIDIERETEQ